MLLLLEAMPEMGLLSAPTGRTSFTLLWGQLTVAFQYLKGIGNPRKDLFLYGYAAKGQGVLKLEESRFRLGRIRFRLGRNSLL